MYCSKIIAKRHTTSTRCSAGCASCALCCIPERNRCCDRTRYGFKQCFALIATTCTTGDCWHEHCRITFQPPKLYFSHLFSQLNKFLSFHFTLTGHSFISIKNESPQKKCRYLHSAESGAQFNSGHVTS